MTNALDTITELTLRSISDDYENFDRIIADVSEWAAERGAVADHRNILDALEALIRTGYAQAYLLSANPAARTQRVAFLRSQLDELWFYVTPVGKALAQSYSSQWMERER